MADRDVTNIGDALSVIPLESTKPPPIKIPGDHHIAIEAVRADYRPLTNRSDIKEMNHDRIGTGNVLKNQLFTNVIGSGNTYPFVRSPCFVGRTCRNQPGGLAKWREGGRLWHPDPEAGGPVTPSIVCTPDRTMFAPVVAALQGALIALVASPMALPLRSNVAMIERAYGGCDDGGENRGFTVRGGAGRVRRQ